MLDMDAGLAYSPVVSADTDTAVLDFDLFPDTGAHRMPTARDMSKVGPYGRNHKNDLADALRVEKRARRVRPKSRSKVR